MSRIATMPHEHTKLARQIHITDSPSAAVGPLDDDGGGAYVHMIGAALHISREQTLAIMANLNFMDLLAK